MKWKLVAIERVCAPCAETLDGTMDVDRVPARRDDCARCGARSVSIKHQAMVPLWDDDGAEDVPCVRCGNTGLAHRIDGAEEVCIVCIDRERQAIKGVLDRVRDELGMPAGEDIVAEVEGLDRGTREFVENRSAELHLVGADLDLAGIAAMEPGATSCASTLARVKMALAELAQRREDCAMLDEAIAAVGRPASRAQFVADAFELHREWSAARAEVARLESIRVEQAAKLRRHIDELAQCREDCAVLDDAIERRDSTLHRAAAGMRRAGRLILDGDPAAALRTLQETLGPDDAPLCDDGDLCTKETTP